MHNLLIISEGKKYLTNAVAERLRKMDYKVDECEPKVKLLSGVKLIHDAILIYADQDLAAEEQGIIYLRDQAVEKDIPVFLLGFAEDMKDVKKVIPTFTMRGEFERPIDVPDIVTALDEFIQEQSSQVKKKILVVDDSGAMLRNVKGWLGDKYQVVLANSGAMAIKYLSMDRPDLVLLDYEMPVVNGKQVLEMIRTETEFSDIPVIFLTSKNDRESIMEVMALKPEGYLLKTMEPAQIVQTVDEFFIKTKKI